MPSPIPFSVENLFTYGSQRCFEGAALRRIGLPLGGIGAGCVRFNGQGGLGDFSIRNISNEHAGADSAFATLFLPEKSQTWLVEGAIPHQREYQPRVKWRRFRDGPKGLPRFRDCSFQGEYPFGTVELADPRLPIAVRITAFNPLIPLDERDSSLPCAILEYTLTNLTERPLDFVFGYHISFFAPGSHANHVLSTRPYKIPGLGAFLYNNADPSSAAFGSCAVGAIGFEPLVGPRKWFNTPSIFRRELPIGNLIPQSGRASAQNRNPATASLLVKDTLAPGQSITIPVVMTWHFPNVGDVFGERQTDKSGWHPYYSLHWANAREVLEYIHHHYHELRARTQAFHDSLFNSTLPNYILEAISASLTSLKSMAMLRQENGLVRVWKGVYPCHEQSPALSDPFWNGSQAMAHLFPSLERALREQEMLNSAVEQNLPTLSSWASHRFFISVDRQLGGILKTHREWCISGDRSWLHSIYPTVRRVMDHCIATWDADHRGVLSEPHKHIHGIEFWGPDGLCSSIYLGALAAMVELSTAANHPEDASFYQDLGQRGAQYMDQRIFNGEYYEQKLMLKEMGAPSNGAKRPNPSGIPVERNLWSSEGPAHQYGKGCISDNVYGVWFAQLCGIKSFQDSENVRRNLRSIFKYNFTAPFWNGAATPRPAYANGDEPGLLICTWPKGGKPTRPFLCANEILPEIEYQVSSHMIAEGMVEEGLTIVKTLRSRYDGNRRNPWEEETGPGSRGMSSFTLLLALTGFRYSALEKTLVLEPHLAVRPFHTFFSTAFAWGTITLATDHLTINVIEGKLPIERVLLTESGRTEALHIGMTLEGSLQTSIATELHSK